MASLTPRASYLGVPQPEDECSVCGATVETRHLDEENTCRWCAADARGRPYGTCRSCKGAKASDDSCACKDEKGRPR